MVTLPCNAITMMMAMLLLLLLLLLITATTATTIVNVRRHLEMPLINIRWDMVSNLVFTVPASAFVLRSD